MRDFVTVQPESQTRLVAKIVRHLLQTRSFESIADLHAELRDHLQRLNIRATPLDVDDAVALVSSNTPLVAVNLPSPTTAESRREAPPVFSRTEAAALLARLHARPRSFYEQAAPSTPDENAPEHFPNLVEVRR